MRGSKAINPFDDESDEYKETIRHIEDGGGHDTSDDDEVFHDAQEGGPTASTVIPRFRVAPLNFDHPFDQIEEPALTFTPSPTHPSTFQSPLESALMEDRNFLSRTAGENPGYSTFPNSHRDSSTHQGRRDRHMDDDGGQDDDDDDFDDELTEESPLLLQKTRSPPHSQTSSSGRRRRIPAEIDTGNSPSAPISSEGQRSISIRKKNKRKSSSHHAKKPNIVLKELASGENEFLMDYKYILLEDLGTASSWMILLLPYIAFFLALLLESSRGLQVTTLGPLTANQTCPTPYVEDEAITSVPLMPCYTSFQDRTVDQGRFNPMTTGKNASSSLIVSYSGVVFDSGALPPIPVLSTDFNGDIFFNGVSSSAVALVSQGQIQFSVLVLQEASNLNIPSTEWLPTFSSLPRTLNMACIEGDDGLWYCKAPRLVDVVFSMPDSAVYGGGELRVNIFFSLDQRESQPVEQSQQKSSSHSTTTTTSDEPIVFINKKKDASILIFTDTTDKDNLLMELATSSAYTFEHMSPLAMKVDTGMRLGTFIASLCFVIYWCKNMQINLLFSCCSRRKGGT